MSNSTSPPNSGLGTEEIAIIVSVLAASFFVSMALLVRFAAAYEDSDFDEDVGHRRKGGWKEWASLRSNLSIRQRLSTLSTYYSGKVEAEEGLDGNLEAYTRDQRHETNMKLPKQPSKPLKNDSTRTLREVKKKEGSV